MISLRGKNALVTGGSRGIGAATAVLLADAGANVGIGYRSREAEAASVVRDVARRGVEAFAHAADLSSADATRSLFERARREFGGLDIFVGNAGIWPAEETPVSELSDERWIQTKRQNVESIY
jgi:3-oxoacyl-[acyl-carrier protein] reductase